MSTAPPTGQKAPVPGKLAKDSTPGAPSEPQKTPNAQNDKPASVGSVPSVVPSTPKPQPTGDHAMLRDAHAGATSYDVLEDGQGVLTVAADELFTLAAEAKAMGYRLLSNLSAYDRTDHFGVLYCFVKPASNVAEFAEMRLRVVMPKTAGEPKVQSLVDLFPAADWQEREMFDMYGITFLGHPDLRRMFLPEGWSGYPMRKDNKEPEQFVALRDGEDVVVKTNEEGSW